MAEETALNIPSASNSSSITKPLTVTFNDKKELYKSYMPFIKGGAIFIPTDDKIYQRVGTKVFVIMKIKDEKKQQSYNKPFSGIIIWITATGANPGIGISFGDPESSKQIKEFIETFIIDVPNKAEIQSYTI